MVGFCFQFCQGLDDAVIKIGITLLEKLIFVVASTPAYLTFFCHFRVAFNLFAPEVFASPLFLHSVVFAEITFASHMNEVWELALVAELMKSEK